MIRIRHLTDSTTEILLNYISQYNFSILTLLICADIYFLYGEELKPFFDVCRQRLFHLFLDVVFIVSIIGVIGEASEKVADR